MDHHDAQRFPVSAVGGSPLDRVLTEICVDDLNGALAADRAGADRVELCANLFEGGTTPSMGLIRSVMHSVKRAGVQVIVRPRGGDFVYDETEIDVMCHDLRAIADAAAHASTHVGVVAGVLTPTGEVDGSVLKRLVAAAAPLAITFHKAFDQTPDLLAAYEVLREAGVERVLTSGGPGTALDGVDTIAELVRRSGHANSSSPGSESAATQLGPAVLVGGSVRAANVREILSATGAREVHARLQVPSDRGDGTLQTDASLIADLLGAAHAPAADSPRASTVASGSTGIRDQSVAIALDVGGTNLKGAVVDASGRSIASRSIRAGNTGDQSIARIVQLLTELRDHARLLGHTVVGVGVVTPGMVDAKNGIVRYASSLDWTDVPLRAILSTELGVPVEIDHDVRSSGLAESLFGASADVHNSVLVAIGTGVAASILSDGHPVVGAITTAGELGHIPVIPDGENCTCGQRGCLEVYLSGAGLARRYAAAGGVPGLDAAAISSRLSADPIADRVWAEGVHAFALGLTSATLLIDPLVIVLTGGVSRAGDRLLGPLRAELQASLAWRNAPEIRLSELGTAGALIGAAVLAFRAGGQGDAIGSWSLADVLSESEPLGQASVS